MTEFKLNPVYTPLADQPAAIGSLSEGLEHGERIQTLLGATGTGKTFTMAGVIAEAQRPALVMAHNKTLAAQLCNEFKEFFPDNAVEYFVSYYDYYQPEAYVPAQDLYIEKDSSINDEIDRLRHAATASLLARRDVIIVASVSCIYGIGSPALYSQKMQLFKVGEWIDRDEVLRKLVRLQYQRNDTTLSRGAFRVRGEVLEIMPSYAETAYRISLFGDEIESIHHFDPLTGEILDVVQHASIWPATHYVTEEDSMDQALERIREELDQRLDELEREGKELEAHRLRQRTLYDLEMLRETGFTSGIENYSRPFEGRAPGSPPHTLIDYFPDDFICFVDESHQTIPQIGGMYLGDRSRKQTLVDFGFRLPSAIDNRPLKFDEFMDRMNQLVLVSATPGEFERTESSRIVEQIVRPTGIVDPEIDIRPTVNQIDDLMNEIRVTTEAGERTLVPKSRNVEPELLMEALFRNSDLESRFSMNMNVLDGGLVPRVMTLKEVLRAWLNHQQEVLVRRSNFRLEKVLHRLEVLEGYLIVYLNIDEVIRIIRFEDEPKAELMKKFKLTDVQAEAILNLRLRRLHKLEEMEIRSEHDKLAKERDELEKLIKSEARQWTRIKKQVAEIRKMFGHDTALGARRTEIASAPAPVVVDLDQALIEKEPITIVCSAKGWIKAMKGHGVNPKDLKYKDGDKGEFILEAQTTDKLLIFGSNGRFYTLGCDKLPPGRGFGEPLRIMVDLPNDSNIVSMALHATGVNLLVASSDGRGFMVKSDDVLAQTKGGKQVLNVSGKVRAAFCKRIDPADDHLAVMGKNRKMLVFALEELPEMTRGKGVILQKYKDGGLADAKSFNWEQGLEFKYGAGMTKVEDLNPWVGKRASAGRLPPNGFPKNNQFD